MEQIFFVGTYTEPILFGTGQVFCGKGKGIYRCVLRDTGIEVREQIDCRNPSFLCLDENRKKIYAVNEMKEYKGAFGGGLTQFSYEDGLLSEERDMGTGGTDPCHVALSPNGGFLSVANFANGSVTIFPLDDRGNLTEKQVFVHEGSSVHSVRQRGPHAHATVFLPEQQLMFVPDLGIDTVKAYRYEGSRVLPAPEFDFFVPPGSGPRSGVFSQDGRFFYLIHEISSQVSCFVCEKGRMTLLEIVETLPDRADKSANICSDLHITPDGQYLFAANRGHDTLCCFKVGADGRLVPLRWTSCRGRTPRNFAIDPSGRFLLVGNQESDTIALFSIEEGGELSLQGLTPFPSPVCIRFLTA